MIRHILPEAGDIVLLNFDPTKGTEQAGLRPALVVSEQLMHSFSRRMIVCPITSNLMPWPTKVFLADDQAVTGAILVDQVRAVDREARTIRLMGKISPVTLQEVRGILASLCGMKLAIETD